MHNKGSKYYLSRLPDGEKNLYDKICASLLSFEPALSIHAGMGKPFELDICRVLHAVLFDNPVFFYVNRERVLIKQTPMYIQLIFNYDYTRDEAKRLWEKIKGTADLFVAEKIRDGMSPLARQLEVHRYITKIPQAKKPYGKDCFSVVGAFLGGGCVCEGYSKAYKLLCDRVGIASIVVLGEGISPNGAREDHAWNITRINGVTAHTDATWDARYGVSNYDYFNLSDADISSDHAFDPQAYPSCEPNKINYFYKNGLIAYDEEELCTFIRQRSGCEKYSVKLLFELDFSRAKELPFEAGEIRFNKSQNIISYYKMGVE